MHQFHNLFWHETLHVSGSSSVHRQEFIHCTLGNGIYHTGLLDSFQAGPGWFYYKEICYDAQSHERKINELNILLFTHINRRRATTTNQFKTNFLLICTIMYKLQGSEYTNIIFYFTIKFCVGSPMMVVILPNHVTVYINERTYVVVF
jgi:hypothetical protein